jgi:hypothetical protein
MCDGIGTIIGFRCCSKVLGKCIPKLPKGLPKKKPKRPKWPYDRKCKFEKLEDRIPEDGSGPITTDPGHPDFPGLNTSRTTPSKGKEYLIAGGNSKPIYEAKVGDNILCEDIRPKPVHRETVGLLAYTVCSDVID